MNYLRQFMNTTGISTPRHIPLAPAAAPAPSLVLGRRPRNESERLQLRMEIQTLAAQIRPQGFPQPETRKRPTEGRRYEKRQLLRRMAIENYRRIQAKGVDPKYLHSRGRSVRAIKDALAS